MARNPNSTVEELCEHFVGVSKSNKQQDSVIAAAALPRAAALHNSPAGRHYDFETVL